MGNLLSNNDSNVLPEQRVHLMRGGDFENSVDPLGSRVESYLGAKSENYTIYRSREEALSKGRNYGRNNFDKALHALMAALEFSNKSPKASSDSYEAQYLPPKFLGCHTNEVSFGRYDNEFSKLKSGEMKSLKPFPCWDVNTVGNANTKKLENFREEENFKKFGMPNSNYYYESTFNEKASLQENCYPSSDFIDSTIDSSNQTSRHHSGYSITHEDEQRQNLGLNISNLNERDNKTAETCDAIGQLYFTNQKFNDALQWFDKAIVSDPWDPTFLYHKGVVYQSNKDYQEAAECFYSALKLDENYVAARFNLGVVLMDKNPFSALEQFHYLIDRRPDDTEVMSLISKCYDRIGQPKEAICYLNKLLSIDSENFQANKRLNELKQKLNMSSNYHSHTQY